MSASDRGRRADGPLVTRAADFATRRHAAQPRKSSAREPYLNHLADVASLLADAARQPDTALKCLFDRAAAGVRGTL